jgi:cell division protein FtsB
VTTPAQKDKTAQPSSPLHKIASALAHVISKHPIPGQTKTALTEILELVKKENGENERARTYVPMTAVKALHVQFKRDLVHVQNSIESKISDLQSDQKKLQATTDSLSKSTENLQSTAKDLESKVVKVNDSTDKLASTAMSY